MSTIALAVRSLVAAARGDAATAAAAGVAQLASMFALNGGAKNALTSAREGISEGRKSIAPLTLAGLVLARLDAIEKGGADVGARPVKDGPDMKARQAAADAYGEAMATALLQAVADAKASRKAAAAARAADKAPTKGDDSGTGDGSTQNAPQGDASAARADSTVGIDLALMRCAGFAPDSLADAIAANSDARAVLSAALAILAARDTAGTLAGVAVAAEGAAAAVAAAAASSTGAALAWPALQGVDDATGAPLAAVGAGAVDAAPAAAVVAAVVTGKGRRVPKGERMAA
jgi:trimeric autotransporter adhesin